MSEKENRHGPDARKESNPGLSDNKSSVTSPPIRLTSPSNSGTGSTEAKEADKSPARPDSPDPNCSICLGELHNKSFTDNCFHTFCFTCLLEWSKVKAVCPLCKQPFQSIIHNVRSIQDYDQYEIRRHNPQPSVPDELTTGGRFRYRTTLTTDRWMLRHLREQSRQISLLLRPTSITTRSAWGRLRQTSTSEFRRGVYENGLRVQEFEIIPGRPVRQRNISPEFFRRNPACTHRLVPWLNRELNVLLENQGDRVQLVLELIIDIIQRFEIGGEIFRTHLEAFLGRRTDHFVHEFIHFARSPFDICAYDRHAVYEVNPESIDPLSILTVDSSSDSEDDNNNNEDPDIIILSPSEVDDVGMSDDHSYFSRTNRIEPPAVRLGLSEHFLMTPIMDRQRSIAPDRENNDPGHSGWDSPVPGPSTLTWSPPHPVSPTASVEAITDGADISVVDSTITNHNAEDGGGSDDDIVVTGYERPYEERTPERTVISSDEDDELKAALIASLKTQEEEKKIEKEEMKKRLETLARMRKERLSSERSRSRSRSSHRNRRSSSRHNSDRSRRRRSRSRDSYYHRSRSGSRRRRSRSRERGNGYRNGTRSRSQSRYHDSRYTSSYSRGRRSRSSERYRARSRSRSSHRYGSSRGYRHRSGSSGIEVIGEKPGDRHRNSRDHRRQDGRRRRRSDSRDSIEFLESRSARSSKRSRGHDDKSPTQRKKASKASDSSNTNTSSAPSGRRKKQEQLLSETPVLLTKIKVEPTECKKHPTGHKSSSSNTANGAVPGTSVPNSGPLASGAEQDSTHSASSKVTQSGQASVASEGRVGVVSTGGGQSKGLSSSQPTRSSENSVIGAHNTSKVNRSLVSNVSSANGTSGTTQISNSGSSNNHNSVTARDDNRTSKANSNSIHKNKGNSIDKTHHSSRSKASDTSQHKNDSGSARETNQQKKNYHRRTSPDRRPSERHRDREGSNNTTSDRHSYSDSTTGSSRRYHSSGSSSRNEGSSKLYSHSKDNYRSDRREDRDRNRTERSTKHHSQSNDSRGKETSRSKKTDSNSTQSCSSSSGGTSASKGNSTSTRPVRSTTAGLAAELRKAAMRIIPKPNRSESQSGAVVDLDSLEKSLREKLTKRLKNPAGRDGADNSRSETYT